MPKIAAVVLLFNPSEEVYANIESYRKEVETLYVVDNTEDKMISRSLRERILALPNVRLIHQHENIGIAKALNMALYHAEKEGCKWLLTMDQDSSFSETEWSAYLSHFKTCLVLSDIGLLSPLHNPKFVNTSLHTPCMKQEAVLTSGNLVSVQAALEVAGYDERLFIDEVDHAFCFALQQKGYAVYVDRTVYLNHRLGTAFGTVGNIKLYAPERLYYMLRNYLYLRAQYAEVFPDFFKTRGAYLIKFFMKQLLFGQERIQNIHMLKQGYDDYRHKRYGRYHAA